MSHLSSLNTRKPKGKVKQKLTLLRKASAAARWEKHAKPAESDSLPDDPNPQPSVSASTSTSSKKIDSFEPQDAETFEEREFFLVQRSAMKELVSFGKCSVCAGTMKLLESSVSGFARKLTVICEACGAEGSTYTSKRIVQADTKRAPFEVNRKIVEAFTAMGNGYSAMEKLGMELGVSVLSASGWKHHIRQIESHNEEVKQEILERAWEVIRKAHGASKDQVLDIGVSYDGSWQKRGHTSLNGCAFVIDILTGLIIDYVVLSKYCVHEALQKSQLEEDSQEYKDWLISHRESNECQMNYEGPSGGMEAMGAQILWTRSVNLNKMRYTILLSDGDAKTFSHLQKIQPYGPDVLITKEECINHVGKRMATALKDAVQEKKGTKSALGGRGEGTLTDVMITKLTGYYRRAIVENLDNVEAMSNAIWAPFYHYTATDQKPNHKFCPPGKESWCFYKRSQANQEQPESHAARKHKLSALVAKAIQPIYSRLSAPSLLERCTRGATQNSNESLHAQVWRLSKKETFVTRPRLEVAVNIAASEFNMGPLNALTMRKTMSEEDLPSAAATVAVGRVLRRKMQSAHQQEITKKRFKKKQEGKMRAAASRKKSKKEEPYRSGAH